MANSIKIGDISIHQSSNGLYSLNDLHKASGKEQRHNPKYWLKNDQAKEMIGEILNGGIPTFKPIEVLGGRYGGTYACRELVYSYAMWVSAKFALIVIKTFDDFVTAATQQELTDAKHRVDNAMQRDMFEKWQSPRDPACLQVIMKCSPFQAKQYHDELVWKGILGYKDVQQPPRRQYFARKSHPAIIGRNGETVLFDESIKELLPTQTDFVEFSGFEGVAI